MASAKRCAHAARKVAGILDTVSFGGSWSVDTSGEKKKSSKSETVDTSNFSLKFWPTHGRCERRCEKRAQVTSCALAEGFDA